MSVLHELTELVWCELRDRVSIHPMHPRPKYPDVVFDHVTKMDADVVHAAFWEAATLGYITGPVEDRFSDEDTAYTPTEFAFNVERTIVCIALEQLVADHMARIRADVTPRQTEPNSRAQYTGRVQQEIVMNSPDFGPRR